jgi:hypothetical protein
MPTVFSSTGYEFGEINFLRGKGDGHGNSVYEGTIAKADIDPETFELLAASPFWVKINESWFEARILRADTGGESIYRVTGTLKARPNWGT